MSATIHSSRVPRQERAFARAMSTTAFLQGRNRQANYYDNDRPELAALVPGNARWILDVGCGKGRLGRLLRQEGHHVCGIELVSAIAEEAAGHLDEVLCGDVETAELPWPERSFDAIICADVLEHLIDPWQTTRRLASLLVPRGLLIASIPNVQNWRVIRNLIRGRWDYRERGILDHGHLRFFTSKSIQELFEKAGLELTDCRGVWNPTFMRRLLGLLTWRTMERYHARYYIVVGKKAMIPAKPQAATYPSCTR